MNRKLAGLLTYLLLDHTPSEGGDGNGTATVPPPPPARAAEADPTEGFKAALKKHGDDANGLARESWAKAEEYRRERDEARGKLPKDGAIVLEGDAAAEWLNYSKLGKFADVRASLDTIEPLTARVKGFERRDLLASAAAAAGHDGRPLGYSPTVLEKLAGDGLRIEVVEKKVGGKDAKVAEVVTVAKDDKGQDVEARTPLDQYAAKHWPEFLPSLRRAPAEAPRGTPPSRPAMPVPETNRSEARPSRPLPRV